MFTVATVNGCVNRFMKLYLLLTSSGRIQSPELLTEQEVYQLRQDSDRDLSTIEVNLPWERSLPISELGGRGKSPYDLKEGEKITHIRVPESIAEDVKRFAIWRSHQI